MSEFYTVNPTDGEQLAVYKTTSASALDQTILAARSAQREWSALDTKQKMPYFEHLIAGLEKHKNKLARLITLETGKTIIESEAEVERCKIPLRYYIEHGEKLLSDEQIPTDAKKSYIRYESIGLVASFTPSNYPLWGVFRQLAPALLCGNALVIKGPNRIAGSLLSIIQIVANTGVPKGLVSAVFGNWKTAEQLISTVELVVAVTSTQNARKIGEIAGRHLKRTNFELSGSDPFIVLEDSDVELAAKKAVASRLMNCGQDCVSAKRFIIKREVYGKFLAAFKIEIEKVKLGSPSNRQSSIGPLLSEQYIRFIETQLRDAVNNGANILVGGKRGTKKGNFFLPTILIGVSPKMRVWQEETFGPIAPIVQASSDAEAVALANNSPFGLGASIWTRDLRRGEFIAARLECGVVSINEQPKSNPAMPFGGVKLSGMGRDFSKYGLMHFLNTKSVQVFKQ
ncbi:MAG: aldehyde dehydrogenase family protein [Candidatus Micrarchaeota archaeon]